MSMSVGDSFLNKTPFSTETPSTDNSPKNVKPPQAQETRIDTIESYATNAESSGSSAESSDKSRTFEDEYLPKDKKS